MISYWGFLGYVHAQSLSRVWLFATAWTVACQAPLSMGFSRQEYWSELPFPLPGDLPNLGIESCLLCFLHWQVDSLPLNYLGGPCWVIVNVLLITCTWHIYINTCMKWKSDSLQPHSLYSPRNSPWSGVGSLSLLQGIFPTQGSNPDLPHCRRILCSWTAKEAQYMYLMH